MSEEWKHLEPPFNSYQVSNLGRFKSDRGTILICSSSNNVGNLRVRLRRDDDFVRGNYTARDLVAKHFLADYNPTLGIRHKDGDRTNIAASNLELYDKMQECEDTSRPTRSQLEKLMSIPLTVADIAERLNTNQSEIYRLMQIYELRSLYSNKLAIGKESALTGDSSSEVWRVPVNISSKIEVSNLGRVRTIETGRLHKINTSRDLPCFYGGNKEHNLAKAVAELFVPNPNSYTNLRFLDGDKTNCRADNLTYAQRADTHDFTCGENYYSEAPLFIQEYIRRVEDISLTNYAKEKNLTISRMKSSLRRFGFSCSTRNIITYSQHHKANGTYEDYVKGLANIERVELLDGEEFRPVEDYPSYYVSNLGRIISHKVFRREELLTTSFHHRDLMVALTNLNKTRTISLKYLVAQAFIPNPDCYKKVLTIDSDRTNCKVDNLKWVSHEEFKKKSYRRVRELQTVSVF